MISRRISEAGSTSFNETADDAPSRPYMPILSKSAVASVAMVAAPNILGSFARVPVALFLEEYSTRVLHLIVMVVSLLGILGLMILSFVTQSMGELGLGFYFAYLIFGAIGGIGKLLTIVINRRTSTWHRH